MTNNIKYKSIEAVIFDWAGTTVDFGCFAPVWVFIDVFQQAGIEVSMEEARKPMGMLKRDHIRTMLEMPRISKLWEEKKDRPFTEADIDVLHDKFEPLLLFKLHLYAEPIAGVIQTVEQLRATGLKIGSTTGYTDKMMRIVSEGARIYGYKPDACFTADATAGKGRPWPYMIYRNLEKLEVSAAWRAVKFGDTVVDISEGVNAGCWSVGIIKGSSLMGLSQQEYDKISAEQKIELVNKTRTKFYDAGADFVIYQFSDIPELLAEIDRKIESGARPAMKLTSNG